MTATLHEVVSWFQLDELSQRDQHNPATIAQHVLNMYSVHTQGWQQFKEIEEELKRAGPPEQLAELRGAATHVWRHNTELAANMLGDKTIHMTALREQPIHFRSTGSRNPVPEATGVISADRHGHPKLGSRDPRISDLMFVFAKKPHPNKPHRTDWWMGRVVDTSFDPLVAIEIETEEPHHRRHHFPPQVRKVTGFILRRSS